MLPVLLLESGWKLLWLGVVAAPAWSAHHLDAATRQVAGECLWVVIILAVIPWRYVARHYLAGPGEPWRRSPRA